MLQLPKKNQWEWLPIYNNYLKPFQGKRSIRKWDVILQLDDDRLYTALSSKNPLSALSALVSDITFRESTKRQYFSLWTLKGVF